MGKSHLDKPRLARVVGNLSGASARGGNQVFELVVCLASGGQVLPSTPSRPVYRARRLAGGVEIWSGRLILEDDNWALHSNDDDDPICFFKFGALRPGEYMTMYTPGGNPLGFRIVNVDYPAGLGDLDNAGVSAGCCDEA